MTEQLKRHLKIKHVHIDKFPDVINTSWPLCGASGPDGNPRTWPPAKSCETDEPADCPACLEAARLCKHTSDN